MFWNELYKTGMDARTRNALKLVLLTGMRPGKFSIFGVEQISLNATFVDRRGGIERTRRRPRGHSSDTKNSIAADRASDRRRRGRSGLMLSEALGAAIDVHVFVAKKKCQTPSRPAGNLGAELCSRRDDVLGGITPHRLRAMCAFLNRAARLWLGGGARCPGPR